MALAATLISKINELFELHSIVRHVVDDITYIELCGIKNEISSIYHRLVANIDVDDSFINNSSVTIMISRYIHIVKEATTTSNYVLQDKKGYNIVAVNPASANEQASQYHQHKVREMVGRIESIKVRLNNANDDSKCETCNVTMTLDSVKNIYICQQCSNIKASVETVNTVKVTPSYTGEDNINRSLTKELNRILGKVDVTFTDKFKNKVIEFKKKHYNKNDFTYKDYRRILKELKESRNYKNITKLMIELDGIQVPNPSREDFMKIIDKAKKIVIAFNNANDGKNKNNLNTHYAIRRAIMDTYKPSDANYRILDFTNEQTVKTCQEKDARLVKALGGVNVIEYQYVPR
jgi:hypothetical protein